MTQHNALRILRGAGAVHSEFNGSETEPVHFFQIWILPERDGIAPGYEQKLFLAEGDGAAIENETALTIASDGSKSESEILLFDLG